MIRGFKRWCISCGRAYFSCQPTSRYCEKRCQQAAYRARLAMSGNYNPSTGRPLRRAA